MTPSTLTEDADILICECCFHQKPVPFHLNYPGIKKYWDAFGAKRAKTKDWCYMYNYNR